MSRVRATHAGEPQPSADSLPYARSAVDTVAENGRDFVESLARGLRVLESFAPTRPAMGLTELARAAGLDKRTTHRLAMTLTTLGYLVRNSESRSYSLGLRAVDLGIVVMESFELRQRAWPYISTLSKDVQQFVGLAVLDGGDIVTLDTARPTGVVVGSQLMIGQRSPAYTSSHGKLLLAFLSDDEVRGLYGSGELLRPTVHTVSDLDVLLKDLAQIRIDGYAVNDEESSLGVRSIAAPIRDRRGDVLGSVNVAVPASKFSRDQLIKKFATKAQRTGEEISSAFGYRGSLPGV